MTRTTALLALLAVTAIPMPGTAQEPVTPYWQQGVAYDITARLDEASGVLSGGETVRYTNHSPDTLTTFALHLYLNAFRPGSRWSDADSAEGRRRFNDLQDPDYGFNHVRNVRITGQRVTAEYPFAPDSTIVRFTLPRPLAPGASMTVEMEWDARPSTTPRRQGREGRRFDFAQWYPRVVTYDRYGWEEHPLYPAGEFYGEFATFTVDLDVPSDQVVGATGVPVCGDPGWESANQAPSQPVDYQRDWYGADSPGCPTAAAGNGRKLVRWFAKDVHHFAMSLNPAYRYEGGHYENVAVHVLYQPGDEKSWGNGVAVRRTELALQWLNQTFGDYVWPQITNVHRIEGGGTEFPMMIMDGSASQGLIVHELGHNYVMGILANNEWKEGFLDEGFTSYQTSRFGEEHGGGDAYPGTENFVLNLDLNGWSEPVSLVSEDYRNFTTYNLMIYVKGELFYHQLRYIVGDSVMAKILRTYYDRYKLHHVNEDAFRDVAEEVSGMDLHTFFAQWLHTTVLYDYAVGDVRRTRLADGRWRTRVEVKRLEDGIMPVDVAFIADGDTTLVRAPGRDVSGWVEAVTARKPDEIVIDPRVRAHDWNMLNNRKKDGWIFGMRPAPRKDHYLDPVFSTRVHRDEIAQAWLPTVWYNDAAGVTLGLRTRSNYLGMFEDNMAIVSRSTGWSVDSDPEDWNWRFRVRNPLLLRKEGATQTLDVFDEEGRRGALVEMTQAENKGFGASSRTVHGLTAQWVATHDLGYLDPGYYEDAGTLEGQAWVRHDGRHGAWRLGATVSLGGGVEYLNSGPGVATDKRFDAAMYFRGHAEGRASRALGKGFQFAARAFAGVAESKEDVVRQRRFFLGGADPYQQLGNPFIRSVGAPLAGEDMYYHVPGGGNLRGFDPRVSANQVYAMNVEVSKQVYERRGGLFNQVSLAAFGDAAMANGDLNPAGGDDLDLVGDAGVGLRIAHRIGQTRFMTRFDLPLYVSRPALAQDTHPGTDQVGFRWTFSFEPAW